VKGVGEEPNRTTARKQRWASTVANRSNARHRSNIRAPTPPTTRCMYLKCGNLCGQRGRKRFIASWGLRMSHICLCTPCPSPQLYRSKVESRHFAHHCKKAWSSVKSFNTHVTGPLCMFHLSFKEMTGFLWCQKIRFTLKHSQLHAHPDIHQAVQFPSADTSTQSQILIV
jgi:hypothetical protein